jgi:hypothetical protein
MGLGDRGLGLRAAALQAAPSRRFRLPGQAADTAGQPGAAAAGDSPAASSPARSETARGPMAWRAAQAV